MSMQAAVAGTRVWIQTAPNNYTPVTVGTDWTSSTNYTPTGTSLKVYGNITGFNCSGTSTTITPVSAINAIGNRSLQYLECYYNQLTSLEVGGLMQLRYLDCGHNQLTSLEVTGVGLMELLNLNCAYNQLTSLEIGGLQILKYLSCSNNLLTNLDLSERGLSQLEYVSCGNNRLQNLTVLGLNNLQILSCSNNQLTYLNVQGLTQLQNLRCSNNLLTSLDVQSLTQLQNLRCSNNRLTSLDVSELNQLKTLWCYGNPCTSSTSGLDQFYCQLPQKQASDGARIYVSAQAQADVEGFVLATNRANANSKNWNLYGYYETTNIHYGITNTTGSYVCGTGIESVESTVSIYPNPVRDILNIKSDNTIESLELYDALGRLVVRKNTVSDNISIDVSNLNNGIYILKLHTTNGIGRYKIVVGK